MYISGWTGNDGYPIGPMYNRCMVAGHEEPGVPLSLSGFSIDSSIRIGKS